MLGSLLELRLAVPSVIDALDFHERLGFRSLQVADIVPGPYAVVAAGGIALGLHQGTPTGPTPTFVRPGLASYSRAFRRLGLAFEFAHLANDEFHRLGFLDPSGLLVTLLEARTFFAAPSPEDLPSACGGFLELCVSTRSLGRAKHFWTALGLEQQVSGETPHPWARLAGHGLVLGLHETGPFPNGLTFHASQLQGRVEYLKAKGFDLERGVPFGGSRDDTATLRTPHGTPYYLVEKVDL